jgi:hypothetical protein
MLSSGPPTVLPSYFLLTEKPAHLDQFNKISMDYKQYFCKKKHFFNYAVAIGEQCKKSKGITLIQCYFAQNNLNFAQTNHSINIQRITSPKIRRFDVIRCKNKVIR